MKWFRNKKDNKINSVWLESIAKSIEPYVSNTPINISDKVIKSIKNTTIKEQHENLIKIENRIKFQNLKTRRYISDEQYEKLKKLTDTNGIKQILMIKQPHFTSFEHSDGYKIITKNGVEKRIPIPICEYYILIEDYEKWKDYINNFINGVDNVLKNK